MEKKSNYLDKWVKNKMRFFSQKKKEKRSINEERFKEQNSENNRIKSKYILLYLLDF